MASYYPGNDLDLGTPIGANESLLLDRRDRARHTYMVGASRTGKTKLLEDMARQDICHWPNHQCPMVLIDPHGTLYSNLMAFAAAEGFDEWPIIPFDLRRDDLVVSYNLLRRRGEGADPAVVCRGFVEAIIHAWGQTNTNETPRLATWLETLLMLAYERECSLAEAMQIINNPALRKLVTHDIQHLVARNTLEAASRLPEREFEERVESTLNRVNRFLGTQLMRATLCQGGESLSMDKVLEQGSILLVSLSTEKTKVAADDAAALGSVLLSDLWTAAKRRGKREEGELNPCYVYLDEFQNFLSPTIAKGLSEASGFGLHLTLAHQYPSQLMDHGGDVGRMILNSVLANARNKILFQLSHPEDLEMMASILFRQSINPNLIKDEIYSTKVVGHEVQYLPSFSQSESKGNSHGWTHTQSDGVSRTQGMSLGHTTGSSDSLSVNDSIGDGESSSVSAEETSADSINHTTGANRSRGRSQGRSAGESQGMNWSDSHSQSNGGASGTNKSKSQSHTFGRSKDDFETEHEAFVDGEENEEYGERHSDSIGLSDTLGENESKNWSTSDGTSKGGSASTARGYNENDSTSEGTSESLARNASIGKSRGRSEGASRTRTRGQGRTRGTSNSDTIGYSEAVSEQSSEAWGETGSESSSKTAGRTDSPMLMPIYGKELSSRTYATVEEQLFKFTKILDGQPDRHCILRLASSTVPIALYTRTVSNPGTTPEWASQWSHQVMERLPFISSLMESVRRLKEREQTLRDRLSSNPTWEEPRSVRHDQVCSSAKKVVATVRHS